MEQDLMYFYERRECDVSLNDKTQKIFPSSYTLDQMLEKMWNMPKRPNILVKPSENAKWYVKWIDPTTIEDSIAKQRSFRDLKGYTMWIIELEK